VTKSFVGNLLILNVAGLILVLVLVCSPAAQSQTKPDRVWLAGRYDGNRVIIYFEAVKFGRKVPAGAPRIVDPVAFGFFLPVELSANYIASFLKGPDAHQFAIGDDYDVLSGGDAIRVKLTTLVGTEGDEEVGNDSYVGALATVVGKCPLLFSGEYYVVRRHQEPVCGSPSSPGQPNQFPTRFAKLVDEPVRFDIQTQMVSLLTQKMMSIASDSQRRSTEGHSPAFNVQPFRVADGSLRYYATAQWKSGKESRPDFSIAAWLTPAPVLRTLAFKANQNENMPKVLNVVGLGGGRTGIIFANVGEDSYSTDLIEYHDGLDVKQMPVLQSIAAGE